MKLNKVKFLGYKYFNVFKMDDNSIVEVESTEEEYKKLGEKNPINPVIENGTWSHSYERIYVDTPSGKMEDGQFTDVPTRIDLQGNKTKKYKIIKPTGLPDLSVEDKDVDINGNITHEISQKVEKHKDTLIELGLWQ